ncbi:MAG: amidohydrolase family protein, partial [Chloroflexota bacterium]
EVPAIKRPFLPQHLTDQTEPFQLEKIVFVQAGGTDPNNAFAEVEWVSSLAQSDARIGGIVADAPLENGTAVQAHLETLAKNPLVKGVRRLIQSEGPGFSTQPVFIEAVQMLPSYQLSFDICVLHHQLGDVLQLVEACPNVSFVLDHFGKPDIKSGLMSPWAAQIQQLAQFPNVQCKLSGLITEAEHTNWQLPDLRPYIDHVLDVFTPERVMYGGDWPVSLLAIDSWAGWVRTAETAVADLTAVEKEAIFYKNCLKFYRL